MGIELIGHPQEDPAKAGERTLAVVARDTNIVDLARQACRAKGLKCLHVKNKTRLMEAISSGQVVAVLWDTRIGMPDVRELTVPAGGPLLVTYGAPCSQEASPGAGPMLQLPEDWEAETVVEMIALVIDTAVTKRSLAETREQLRETEHQLEDSLCNAGVLKEHLQFYESQRNQLAEVVRRTAYLSQLSKELNCLDMDRIIDICVTKVPRLVDATLASLYIVNEETSQLTLKQSNHPQRIADKVPLETNFPRLMTLAIERKATLLIRDIDEFLRGIRKPVDRTFATKYRTRSCIVAPLMNDNRPIAVLNLADRADGRPFDEVRDLPLIDHISQFIGNALRNCQLYQRVWHMAKTDALTGFINHNAFFEELNREIARVRRNKANLSLVILDVDNFKLFNDVHGHQVGDMVLSQVAQVIHNNVRTVDIAARYGGDEFAIILADADLENAQVVAERIRRAIATNHLTYNGQTFSVTISAGVTQHKTGHTLSDTVNEADAALYRAKSKGRNVIATTLAV